MVCHLEMSKAGRVDCRNLYYRSLVCFINLLIFEHVAHIALIQTQSSQQFFTLLGAIFYAYLVDKGMSEMDAPESEKERLTLAGHLDRPFPF